MADNKIDKVSSETSSDDNSKAKTQSNQLKSAGDIEIAKLEIERERLELQKNIETSKLEIEKLKLEREKKFWNKNSGTLITASVALAAVIVTLGQVLSTWISQNKQIEMIDRQKEKELALLNEKNRKDWNLNAAKFITDNRKPLFEGSKSEKQLLANVIGTIYPPDVAASILAKLENVSLSPEEDAWRKEREKIVRPSVAESPTNNRPLKRLPQPNDGGGVDIGLGNKYVSEKTVGGCSSRLQTNIENGGVHRCFLTGQDINYCYYDCYPQY